MVGTPLRSLALALLLASLGSAALACPMCLHGYKVKMSAQELAHAQRIVLVRPEGASLRVIEVVKGDVAANSVIAEPVSRLSPPDRQSAKPLLLIREDRWLQWINMGPIAAEYAPWLRRLGSTVPSQNASHTQREALVAFLLPSLESAEPMVAEIAYGEIASAGYGAMRANKAAIDPQSVRRWWADPALSKRHDLYALLVGIAGDSADADAVERRLDAMWKAKDARDLASLLVADLELRGPSRIDWISRRYLQDRSRSPDEQRAATLALAEQGAENSTIARDEVVRAYRGLIAQRNPAAGLAAPYLAEWKIWDVAIGYQRLLDSGVPMSDAARAGIQDYLQRKVHPDASAGTVGFASPPR